MTSAWVRPSLRAGGGAPREELVAPPKAEGLTEWVLLVGENESALESAARSRIVALPSISPPDTPFLPVSVHELPSPGLEGERLLFVRRLDRAFTGNASFAATSPLYLIPAVAQLAAEGDDLHFVATAIESELEARAKDVLAQRGLASRFRIVRVEGDPSERNETAPEVDLSGLAPESGLAQLFLASSLLRRGDRRQAAASLRRASEVSPNLAAAHYELGKLQLQLDDMEGALASFRKTVAILPEYSSAWANLGAALGEVQDLEAALEALNRAVSLDPLSHSLHSNQGVALRDLGRHEEAEACFRRALELEPEFVFGYYNLGHVLYLQNRFEEAVTGFEKAQALDSSRSPRQALLLAITRLASGDREGAFREYREVFTRLEGPMKSDMRTVAEWDLKQLAQRSGATPLVKETAGLLRSFA